MAESPKNEWGRSPVKEAARNSEKRGTERQENITSRSFVQAPNGKLYRRGSITFARDMARSMFGGNWGISSPNEDRTPEQVRAALDEMEREQAERMSARRAESALHLIALELKAVKENQDFAGTVACGGGS